MNFDLSKVIENPKSLPDGEYYCSQEIAWLEGYVESESTSFITVKEGVDPFRANSFKYFYPVESSAKGDWVSSEVVTKSLKEWQADWQDDLGTINGEEWKRSVPLNNIVTVKITRHGMFDIPNVEDCDFLDDEDFRIAVGRIEEYHRKRVA
jgi:hypothetical protein